MKYPHVGVNGKHEEKGLKGQVIGTSVARKRRKRLQEKRKAEKQAILTPRSQTYPAKPHNAMSPLPFPLGPV